MWQGFTHHFSKRTHNWGHEGTICPQPLLCNRILTKLISLEVIHSLLAKQIVFSMRKKGVKAKRLLAFLTGKQNWSVGTWCVLFHAIVVLMIISLFSFTAIYVRLSSQEQLPIYRDQMFVSSTSSFLEKAEIILVTTIGEWTDDFAKISQEFEQFSLTVKFIVVAPVVPVCTELRGNVHATCLDITPFLGANNTRLPVIAKMLQAVSDFATPGVTKWFGIMNGDIAFDKTMIESLHSIGSSPKCQNSSSAPTACVVTGQHIDIDRKTQKRKLHSPWGLDYFFFNEAGLHFVLRELADRPFVVGRIRWDSWLMGLFVSSDQINAIDASNSINAVHFMNFNEHDLSGTHRDTTNLLLADIRFHIGRTDQANYRLDPETKTVVELVPTETSRQLLAKNKLRWELNEEVEISTDFQFSIVKLKSFQFGCFCDLLSIFHPRNISNIASEYCSHVSQKRLSRRIFFQREFFEKAIGIKGIDLSHALRHFGIPKSKSDGMCCLLSNSSNPPSVFPAPFWSYDHEDMASWCLG